MGLWGGIKGIGRRAGNWIGNEAGRVVAPIGSAIEGDWRGALSGIGRNVKRAGQAGALLGKDKLAGIDVDLLGAGGGAIEGGLGPSEIGRGYFGDTGSGGFAGAAGGALKGYGGVQAGKGLHNIGERLGINKRLGAFGDKIGNPFTAGPDYGPTRDEVNQQLMIRPDYEGLTPEEVADAEYLRGQRLQTRSGLYGGTPEMSEAGIRTIHGAGAEDPRSLDIRTAGTPLVPEGKQNWHFFGRGGPGQTPEQQAAIEQAQWRAGVPDQPDPIPMPGSSENPVSNIVPDPEAMERFPGRDIPPGALMDSNIKYGSTGLTGGFHTSLPETPSSERTPLSFPTSQIPEDVIPKSSYMNAPGAVPTPASARENMNAQGVVPAARFGEQSAPGDVEMVGGPVSPGYGTNEYLPIPDASNIARATADEDRMYTGNQPRGHDMASRELALASPRENMKDQAARYRERLMSAPGLGDDTDSGPWWRQGLDYVRDNPDILINAAGRAIESRAQDEYYRRMAAVNEGNQRLRAQQLFYEQDPQRLREQQALSYRSRWQ